jgi:hypothetical protein
MAKSSWEWVIDPSGKTPPRPVPVVVKKHVPTGDLPEAGKRASVPAGKPRQRAWLAHKVNAFKGKPNVCPPAAKDTLAAQWSTWAPVAGESFCWERHTVPSR